MPVDVILQGEAIGEVGDLQVGPLLPLLVDEAAVEQVDDPGVIQAVQDPGFLEDGGDVPVDAGSLERLDDDMPVHVGW